MKKENSSAFKCKSKLIPGKNAGDVTKNAKRYFSEIKSRSKRKPYVRSNYFKGEKVFFDYFWDHIFQKNFNDRKLRLRYFKCAVELLQKSKVNPISDTGNKFKNERYFRFLGQVDNDFFAVQVKENLASRRKYFMSVFQYKK